MHAGRGAFVIANPWDAGSAKILAGLGFGYLDRTMATPDLNNFMS